MPSENDILILGGGFAGQTLARRLLEIHKRVTILSLGPATINHPNLAWHTGSYGDEQLLRHAITRCGTIVHAASSTTPGVSATTPKEEIFGNFQPTLNLIETLQDFSDRAVIYLSSGGTVYGNPAQVPVPETSPCRPISYYGSGKLAVESFFHVLSHQCGCPVTILRPSNLYGPGQNPKAGFGLIFHLLKRALAGQEIEIWGDGSTVRDYLYIQDFVEACLKIIAGGGTNKSVTIYNIGSGAGHSINEVIATVEEVINTRLHKKYLQARAVDVSRIVLDCGFIQQEIGWEPSTSLKQGITATWEWMKST